MSSMSSVSPPQRMTVEEFLALPELEVGHRELIDGEVVISFPTFAHENAVLNLAVALKTWMRGAPGRGTVSLAIDTFAGPTSSLGPDLQWWAEGRELPDRFTRPYPMGDVVLEVRSPSTWALDVGVKRRLYEDGGVQELWLADPLSRTVLVFARSAPDAPDYDAVRDLAPEDELTSSLLPGFAVAIAELFA